MQKTVEYTNNRLSPATVELLIHERSKGKTLRQLGQMFGRSHERIRQVLAKYGLPQVTLLSENGVAAKLEYPVQWLAKLRKEGIITPIRLGGYWLYSEEQVRQIPALIAQVRRCEQCGKLRPFGSKRFCRECLQERRKKSRAYRKRQAKLLERASYVVNRGNYLPLGTIVKVKATRRSSDGGTVAILDSGFEIPFSRLRKVRT